MKKPSPAITKALEGIEKYCVDERRIANTSVQLNHKLLRAVKIHCVIHQCTMTDFVNAAIFRLALKDGVFDKKEL